MAAVYPILYVIENSLRELIKRVMTAKYGRSWWDTALTSGKAEQLKHNSDQMRGREERVRWHQRRGAHEIDYVTRNDLATIIEAKQADFFPHILGDREWFKQFMRQLAASRNVLCHMNPLSANKVRDLKVKAERWRMLVEAQLPNLPPAA